MLLIFALLQLVSPGHLQHYHSHLSVAGLPRLTWSSWVTAALFDASFSLPELRAYLNTHHSIDDRTCLRYIPVQSRIQCSRTTVLFDCWLRLWLLAVAVRIEELACCAVVEENVLKRQRPDAAQQLTLRLSIHLLQLTVVHHWQGVAAHLQLGLLRRTRHQLSYS